MSWHEKQLEKYNRKENLIHFISLKEKIGRLTDRAFHNKPIRLINNRFFFFFTPKIHNRTITTTTITTTELSRSRSIKPIAINNNSIRFPSLINRRLIKDRALHIVAAQSHRQAWFRQRRIG